MLADQPRKPVIAAAADADEAIDYDSGSVTIRLTAQDENGQPLPNCVATAKVNGKNIQIPFAGRRIATLSLSRQGIHHNAASDVY